MCGIAGFTLPAALSGDARARAESSLRAMTQSLVHRGPDAHGELVLEGVALGHTRLSIVDLSGGAQPMTADERGLSVVFNGEIFNHVELREQLSARWHFRTRSDTEVILAAWDAWGAAAVQRFIGQFAFALWDARSRQLWLARDRVGIRPLFFAELPNGTLAFASEARALFAAKLLERRLDAHAIAETVHLWAPVAGRSSFEGVQQLEPGHVALVEHGRVTKRERYWRLDLSPERVDPTLTFSRAMEQVDAMLDDAVSLRLRADVPVAAYLSGGLDSSLLCAVAQKKLGGTLQTFSVAFEEKRFDERNFQQEVARALGTEHHVAQVGGADIGALLPQVVWHTEQVLLRSAPAPFFALSRLVRAHGTKVVLTGEGADEVFLGYDLFKETAVRRFWARRPQSSARPRLFSRLYPFLSLSQQSPEVLRSFFGLGLERPDALDFSHQIRWTNSGRVARFFSKDFAARVATHSPIDAVLATVPEHVRAWSPMARAQFLEFHTLLSGYLLSAQGDRMLMSNSVEGRFPFLDHRLIELSATLPQRFKLNGLDEKFILKRVAKGRVPEAVLQRTKFPYRAPIAEALVGPHAPAWSRELLSREAVDRVGVFDGAKVEKLIAKLAAAKSVPSEADAMALMAIASTQLLARGEVPSSQQAAPSPSTSAALSLTTSVDRSGPADWLERWARETPDAPFLGVPEQPWLTYREAQQRVDTLRALLASLGVKVGDPVMLALPNVIANALLWVAIQSLGATVVEVDREWAELPLSEAVAQTSPALVVIEGRDARRWGTLAGVGRVLVVHPTTPPPALEKALQGRFAGWLSEGGEPSVAPPAVPRVPTDDTRLGQIVFTSGSTGSPRGVMHTVRNIAASAKAICLSLDLRASDRGLLVLPLFYVYGKSVLNSHLFIGGSVFLDHRFLYPRVVMEGLAVSRCTNISGVPLTWELIKRQVDLKTVDLSSLRFVTQAGGAMAQETIDWLREAIAPAKLVVMYGQAEATARLSVLPPERATDKRGSVGRGLPGVPLEVVDEHGALVPKDRATVGELTARGEVIMAGYLHDAEESAKVLRGDRLFTGDLATWDEDGFVFIVGRSRAMLKLGGHRVAPAELERAIRLHPGVREVAVVGAKDALEGEVAVAFVVKADAALDEPTLLKHCRQHLSGPRVPKRVVFLEELPRNTFGKVKLAELQHLAETSKPS
ncbi:MAG: asparagine synthase (glutamine-hydrolyzing) [Myxococcota bacterium]